MGQFNVRIGFIVEETDVEFGLVLLDEIIFKRQGFAGVAQDDGVEVGDFASQRPSFCVHPPGFEEIGTHATAQGCSFAYVEHRACGIFEQVDAGAIGEERGFLPRFHFAEVSRGWWLVSGTPVPTTLMILELANVHLGAG